MGFKSFSKAAPKTLSLCFKNHNGTLQKQPGHVSNPLELDALMGSSRARGAN